MDDLQPEIGNVIVLSFRDVLIRDGGQRETWYKPFVCSLDDINTTRNRADPMAILSWQNIRRFVEQQPNSHAWVEFA